MRTSRQVPLSEVLTRARDGRSYREMARRCGLTTTTVTRLEQEEVLVPNQSTLEALAKGYNIDGDTLALAAYGRYFEEVVEEERVTA